MRQRAKASVVASCCLLFGLTAACGRDATPGGEPGDPDAPHVGAVGLHLAQHLPPNTTIEMARQGSELFPVCSTCHGMEAEGTQLGPSLRDGRWLHGDGSFEEIQRAIREGIDPPQEYPIPMPAGGGGDFTEDEVRALATYVYALDRASAGEVGAPPAGTGEE